MRWRQHRLWEAPENDVIVMTTAVVVADIADLLVNATDFSFLQRLGIRSTNPTDAAIRFSHHDVSCQQLHGDVPLT